MGLYLYCLLLEEHCLTPMAVASKSVQWVHGSFSAQSIRPRGFIFSGISISAFNSDTMGPRQPWKWETGAISPVVWWPLPRRLSRVALGGLLMMLKARWCWDEAAEMRLRWWGCHGEPWVLVRASVCPSQDQVLCQHLRSQNRSPLSWEEHQYSHINMHLPKYYRD